MLFFNLIYDIIKRVFHIYMRALCISRGFKCLFSSINPTTRKLRYADECEAMVVCILDSDLRYGLIFPFLKFK